MTSDNSDAGVQEDPRRVAIFIDGSNLYHSLQENCGRTDIDFDAFAGKLCRGRSIYRTYYYNVLRDPDRNPQSYSDQQKFLVALYATPFLEVRLGASKMRGDVVVEKGIDIMLATDLLRFGWEDLYDVAILVSGDGDFAYALQAVKNMGKYVEIAAFSSNLAWELVQMADERESFTPEYFSDLWTHRRGSRRSGDSSRRTRRPARPREGRDDRGGARPSPEQDGRGRPPGVSLQADAPPTSPADRPRFSQPP